MSDDTSDSVASVAADLAKRLQIALTAERREHARTRAALAAAQEREVDVGVRLGRALSYALNTRDRHRSPHARDIADRLIRFLTPKANR